MGGQCRDLVNDGTMQGCCVILRTDADRGQAVF